MPRESDAKLRPGQAQEEGSAADPGRAPEPPRSGKQAGAGGFTDLPPAPANGPGPSLPEFLQSNPDRPAKLHLGCGGMRWHDFVNVDLYPADPDSVDSSRDGCIAEAYQDIRSLGLPDGSVEEIFCAHVIEHFPRWEALDILRHWYDVLQPGGQLVIETPDFRKCVLWLFHPKRAKRELARTQFYGNQWDRIDFETHRYVWTLKEMQAALTECGFRQVQGDHRAHTHHAGRDMRVVATK